jgi:hypothetical protein
MHHSMRRPQESNICCMQCLRIRRLPIECTSRACTIMVHGAAVRHVQHVVSHNPGITCQDLYTCQLSSSHAPACTFVPLPVAPLASHTAVAAAAACTRLAGSCSLTDAFHVATARVVTYNWQWCCCCQCPAQAYCFCILLAVLLCCCSSARQRPCIDLSPIWLIGLIRCHG